MRSCRTYEEWNRYPISSATRPPKRPSDAHNPNDQMLIAVVLTAVVAGGWVGRRMGLIYRVLNLYSGKMRTPSSPRHRTRRPIVEPVGAVSG